MKPLDTVVNKKTGSVFYTICKEQDVRASIRIWVERTTGNANTAVGFRVRVEPRDYSVTYFDFMKTVKSKFPTVDWLGKSSSHASFAGGMYFGAYPHQVDAVLEKMAQNDLAGALYDSLVKVLPGMEFDLTRDEFIEFCTTQVMNELNEYVALESAKPAGVLLKFGSSVLGLKGGKEVSPSAAGFPSDEMAKTLDKDSGNHAGDVAIPSNSGVAVNPLKKMAKAKEDHKEAL